jgi:SOS-response transcriptional repressor LexA
MTPKQFSILKTIYEYKKRYNISPTYREIAKKSKMKSVSNICHAIAKLKTEGFIEYEEKKQRSVVLTSKSIKILKVDER